MIGWLERERRARKVSPWAGKASLIPFCPFSLLTPFSSQHGPHYPLRGACRLRLINLYFQVPFHLFVAAFPNTVPSDLDAGNWTVYFI